MGEFKRCIYKLWIEDEFEIFWIEIIRKNGFEEYELF